MVRIDLHSVRYVVAVASGKGGVGKTTVTVRLALALSRMGLRVGIFDADVYGPNVPAMLGVHRRVASQAFVPVVRRADAPAYISPLRRYDLEIMSVGLLLAEDQVINPLAATAGQFVVQTMRDVRWSNLDVLLVDLPPSAGQPQAEMLEKHILDAVVLVTTPQDMSSLDAGRSLQLLRNNNVRVLGLVENMAYFDCPGCGERHEVFARSSAWQSEFLAALPVLVRIPLNGDLGSITFNTNHNETDAKTEFDALAAQVWHMLEANQTQAGQ